jgi:peptidoglycan hydrolase CwlO-like protein
VQKRKKLNYKMVKFNIDIKTGFIIILGLIIVLMILFRPSKRIDNYEKELQDLKEKNIKLYKQNDSLNNINDVLKIQIESLKDKVDSVNVILDKNEKEIKRLKNRKGEVSNNVNRMGVNDVTSNFSKYLKRRG